MTDDDPVPLKAGGEATPELVRALYALGKGGPDAARLARVAEKLGAALADAPPPGTSNGWRKLFGTKTLITGIVIGIAALSWLGYHLAGQHEAPAKPARPAAVETSRLEPGPVPAREPEGERPAAVIPAAAPPSAATRSSGSASRRSRGGSGPSATAQAGPAQSTASTTPTPAVAVTSAAEATDPVPEPEKAKPKPAVQPVPVPAASVAQRSEVELLFDARKAMSAKPEAALRILAEHAARFPSGLLGPEREVLRIEVLRKLGRTTEATQRLHQFESKYPESIHLRRLQGDASSSL
jgi:hypothetical protein